MGFPPRQWEGWHSSVHMKAGAVETGNLGLISHGFPHTLIHTHTYRSHYAVVKQSIAKWKEAQFVVE